MRALSSRRRHWPAGLRLATICLLLSGAAISQGQELVVRTSTPPGSISLISELGKSDAIATEIARNRQLLVLLAPNVLNLKDLQSLQTFLITVFQQLRSRIPVRIGVINGGNVEIAGPLRSAQEIRAILRS